MDYVTIGKKKFNVENGKLDLHSKGIHSITDIVGLTELSELEELILYDNLISDINGLDGLVNLKVLNLFSNGISEIKGLDNLVNLEKLILKWPKQFYIPSSVDLSLKFSSDAWDREYFEKIKKIEGLDKLINLRELDLSLNDITEISGLGNLTNLETLNLQSNRITKVIGLKSLVNLKKLNLGGGNKIPKDVLVKLGGLTKGNHNRIRGWAKCPQAFVEVNLINKFITETRKNAVWMGKLTNAYKEWKNNEKNSRINLKF